MSNWGFESQEEGSNLLNLYNSWKKCKNWKWPLVCSNPNISASTWPKLKIKVSFEILRTSRFQNWPSFLNLMKIWGSYCQKTNWKVFFGTPCISYVVSEWHPKDRWIQRERIPRDHHFWQPTTTRDHPKQSFVRHFQQLQNTVMVRGGPGASTFHFS